MNKNRFIPYARQSISQQDIDEVVVALQSDLITRGPKVLAFEQAIADYCGAKYAVCMTSGTTALFGAFQAANVSASDRFLTTPNSFVATTTAGMRLGARPYFIDLEECSGNMSLDKLAEALVDTPSRGRFVIAPVHFAGIALDMKRLDSMLKTPDVVVIEDAAHAIGSHYPSGEKVGSCAYSQMTIFSFHAIKTITSAEGGCVTTNDEGLYHKLKRFRDSGIEREAAFMHGQYEPWYYEVQELSGNFHMTEMQAALGLSQLQRIEENSKKRKEIVSWYRTYLKDAKQICLFDSKFDSQSVCHLMVVQIDFEKCKTTRTKVMQNLRDVGIGSQYHYIPIYRHPLLQRLYGEQESQFPEMERYYKAALSIPLYADLEEDDVKKVCEELIKATSL